MARFSSRFASVCLVMIGGLFAVGCQQQTAMVPLPNPSFDGPVVMQAPTPRPAPPIAPAPYVAPKPAPQVTTNVPKNWVPPVAPRHWQYIIVHHSATPAGGAARFDREHREKGWDELGYDFVIGNGTDTADGLVEVGPRWIKQKWGAHTKTPDNMYNEVGVGICLVGNFEVDHPTAAQMRSLNKLIVFLMKQYHIPAQNIIGHRDAKPTECPGRNVNIAEIRRSAARELLAQGGPKSDLPDERLASSGELMIDTK